MKKFYAFAAAAMAAMSMNAQLYVCGNGEGLGWTPDDPMVVTEANGTYTLEVKSLVEFKISTTKGTWDEYNAGCLTCAYTADDMGKPVALVSGDGNIGAPWKGDYTLVVSLSDSTLTMTTTTPAPEGPAKIYLRGGMNEWGSPEDWMFSEGDAEGSYYFECKDEHIIPANTEFKIADADWGSYNYGAGGVVTVNTKEEEEDGDEVGANWNYNADNSSLAADFTGTIFVTINDPAQPKNGAFVVFFSNYFAGVANAIVEANEAMEYFNLQGVRVAQPTQGIYVVRQGGKVFKAIVK